MYTIRQLNTADNQMQQVVLERAVRDDADADHVDHRRQRPLGPQGAAWRFSTARVTMIRRNGDALTMSFAELRLPAFTQAPRDLLIEPKNPEEMTFDELGRYIAVAQELGQRHQEAARSSGR